EQPRGDALRVEVKPGERVMNADVDGVRGLRVPDLARRSDEGRHGEVRDAGGVGDAIRLEDRDVSRRKLLTEVRDQSRLADARLAFDVDDVPMAAQGERM